MLYVIVILFQVGIVASVILGIVCLVGRIRVGSRTRRWVSTIEQLQAAPAVGSPSGHPGEKAPVEMWDRVVDLSSHDDELVQEPVPAA